MPAVIITGLSSIYFARLGANLSAKTDSRYLKLAFFYSYYHRSFKSLLHYLRMIVEIDPIAFYIPLPFFGWWPIYWYGISWLVAILSINYIARLNAPAEGVINKKLIDDFIFYGVLGAIVGGRIGYMVFYGMDSLIRDPMTVFKIWEGGLSFHGGLLGVLLSFLFFQK